MIERNAKSSWGSRLSWLTLIIGVGAPLVALIAAAGAGQDWWGKLAGLGVLQYAFFAAAAAVVIAIVAIVVHLRRRSGRPLLIALGLIAALAYLGYIGQQITIARAAPFIHDATTDLADPPAFQALKLRTDNLDSVPDGDTPALKALTPEARWKRLHAEGYPDLRAVTVARPVAATVALAERVARERGWAIAAVDPAGRVEATDSVSLFAFKDDVVIRVRPAPGGSRVDMRSVSRLGASDLGVNARRIREFMRDLREASAAPVR